MGSEKRCNQGYEIIDSCMVGDKEFVIGYNPNAPNPYVCWKCNIKDDYYWGHYFNTLAAAQKDMRNRYNVEKRYFQDQEKNSKKVKAHENNR